MNTWKTERRDYSSNPWRLIDGDGHEVYESVVIDHPDLGPSRISKPVCGRTKQEIVDKVLAYLVKTREALTQAHAKLKAALDN
jgi:hypothetical protein